MSIGSLAVQFGVGDLWEKVIALQERLAAAMRADVYPAMLAREFVANRPNKKRPGKFPVNYLRDLNSNQYDLISFGWSEYKTPSFVVEFEIYRGEANIRRVKELGLQSPKAELRDIGGRIVARKGIINRSIWFGLPIVMIFTPRFVQDFFIQLTVRKVLRRIDELDRFMKGEAPFPKAGYNWNLSLRDQIRNNQNRVLTAEEREKYEDELKAKEKGA